MSCGKNRKVRYLKKINKIYTKIPIANIFQRENKYFDLNKMWLSKTGPTQTNFCATITKDYKKNLKKKKNRKHISCEINQGDFLC